MSTTTVATTGITPMHTYVIAGSTPFPKNYLQRGKRRPAPIHTLRRVEEKSAELLEIDKYCSAREFEKVDEIIGARLNHIFDYPQTIKESSQVIIYALTQLHRADAIAYVSIENASKIFEHLELNI